MDKSKLYKSLLIFGLVASLFVNSGLLASIAIKDSMLAMQEQEMRAQGQYILQLEGFIRQIQISLLNGDSSVAPATCNIEVVMTRQGVVVGYWIHAATLTQVGRDFYNHKVYDSSFANATQYADEIGVGNSADSIDNTWRNAHGEVTTNGFARVVGTYTHTGTAYLSGTCNITHTYTSSGTQTINRYYLFASTTAGDAYLIWADSSTDKNTVATDTLKVTFMITDAQA